MKYIRMLFALLLPCIFTFFSLFLFTSAVAEGAEAPLSPPEEQLRSGAGGVYGRIKYNGVPIHRARIILNAKLQGLVTLQEPSTYTDENGYYFLSNLPPGQYYLAAGWPNEKTYWFLRRPQGQNFPDAVEVQIEAGRYTLVPRLPLYVVIDLQYPSDGAITSANPKFKWSKNQYLQEYEFSLVRREINTDVLQGEIIFKRRPIKGTEFQPRKSLKPGIY
ncbi:MAG: carboxypeptidase-like regulatory domain-containing protein [Dissulfuribacterales bacterium]